MSRANRVPAILYRSVITALNVTGTTSNTGFPASSVANPLTYDWWAFDLVADVSLTVDAGAPVDIDALGVVVKDFTGEFLLESSADNSTWIQRAAGIGSGHHLILLSAAITARYWRITFVADSDNIGSTVRVPVVYLGEALRFEKCVRGQYAPLVMNRKTQYFDNDSGTGQFIGRSIVRQNLDGSVSFERMTAPWVRQHFQPFVEAARERPYFFSWNPEMYPEESVFVRTDEDIGTSYNGDRNLMSASWSMRSAG